MNMSNRRESVRGEDSLSMAVGRRTSGCMPKRTSGATTRGVTLKITDKKLFGPHGVKLRLSESSSCVLS